MSDVSRSQLRAARWLYWTSTAQIGCACLPVVLAVVAGAAVLIVLAPR